MTNEQRGERLGLFDGIGVELEYMIVDPVTLVVRPISDVVLAGLAGQPAMEVQYDGVAWSNELVTHVLELKVSRPARNIEKMHHDFVHAIRAMNHTLQSYGASLLGTAMHPFFDPARETVLWHDEDAVIYNTYNRIFGCSGHGWSNVQSMHINLPFANDDEFGRLHAAIRLVLPLLPALAASSPVVDGVRGPVDDMRVLHYMRNQKRIPSIIGPVIPEGAYSQADYTEKILEPMYRDIGPLDREGVLQYEWLNSRAAIARFTRGAIEIRLMDVQECVKADIALLSGVVGMVRALVAEHWSDLAYQQAFDAWALREILDGVLQQGLDYVITSETYAKAFGRAASVPVRTVIQGVLSDVARVDPSVGLYLPILEAIISQGNLSRRIVKSLGADEASATPIPRESVLACYARLRECLERDDLFDL